MTETLILLTFVAIILVGLVCFWVATRKIDQKYEQEKHG